MKKQLLVFALAIFSAFSAFSQTPQGCNIAAIRAAFAGAGHYTELPVSGQSCSMYFVDNNSYDAATAESNANTLGAHMVVFNDAAENTNVVAALNAGGYLAGGATVWIGVKRVSTGNPLFYMLDGSSGNFTPGPATPSLYQNWSGGEPNNNDYQCSPGCLIGCNAYKCNNGEQCVQIYSGGQWNDLPCDETSKSVIEVNLCPQITASNDTIVCSGGATPLKAKTILGSAPINQVWNPGGLTGNFQIFYPTTPTSYIITSTDRYSCFATDTINVGINTGCNAPPAPKGCGIQAIRNAFTAAGHYTELPVVGQACSMYFIDENPSDAATAESNANALGAHMVVMNDATENANVVAGINAAGYLSSGQKVWIGYKRTGTAAPTFYALDGSTGSFLTPTTGGPTPGIYQNWNGGEPNNSGYQGCTICNLFCGNTYTCNNGEQCVQIYSNGLWNDEDCSDGSSKSVIEVNLCPQLRGTANDTTMCNPAPINLTTNTILGSAPYTYSWNPGGQTTPNITVTPPVGVTNYIARATDRYGCYGEDTTRANVVPISAPVISSVPTPPTVCVGQNIDIDFANIYTTTAIQNWYFDGGTIAGTSGVLPYGVSWSTPGVKNVSMFIIDQGCTSPKTTYPVTVNPSPTPTAGPDLQICSGVNANLGDPGAANTTYSWIPTFGLSSSAISNPIFNVVNPGDTALHYPYVVVATSNGCIGVDTVNLTLYPPVTSTFRVSKSAICSVETDSVIYTGKNTAGATYTWNFDGGTVVSGSGQGPYIVQWNTGGTKNITLDVTENGCPGTQGTQTVIVTQQPIANAGPDVSVCPATNQTLGVAAIGTTTYFWDPPTFLSSTSVADPTFNGTNNTTANITQQYTLVATEGVCVSRDTVVVTLYNTPTSTFTASPTNLCVSQQSTTLTYTGNGTAGATYTWNFDGGTNTGTGQGPISVLWNTVGTKNVTLDVTQNGCPSTQTAVTINVGSPPTVNAGPDVTVCSGGTVAIGSAPIATYTYQWNTQSVLNDSTLADPNFSYLNTGAAAQTFTLTVTASDNGCKASDDVNVTVDAPQATTIIANDPTTFCDGGSANLASNDPNIITWNWSTTETTQSITVSASGTYSLNGFDANHCYYESNTITITEVPNPIVALSGPGIVDETCSNYKDGAITVQASSGTPAYQYIWNTTPPQTGNTISNLSPGTYDVLVTDLNNCTVNGSYTVNTGDVFFVVVDSVWHASCFGFSDGAIFASVNGGIAPYSYLWSNGSTKQDLTKIKAGNYSVTATDGKGCKNDMPVVIGEPAEIVTTTSSNLSINFTEETDIDVTVTPGAAYTYLWSPAASLSCSDCEDPHAFPVRTTSYTLIVTDPTTLCKDTSIIKLLVDPAKKVYIPNAFTPNNDTKNDVWKVFAYGVKYFQATVFNRWGEKVFESADIQGGWDGTFKGAPVQPGIYTYLVNVTYLDGEVVKNQGSLTVIK
ncbi:MAG: gliding motility-associated C-terminal domain-containing protein [Chitinophagales bacterium]